MACLLLEILMLFSGLYLLFRPNVQLTDRLYLEGQRARIVGIIWILPLPLIIVTGLAIGMLQVLEIFPAELPTLFSCLEPLIVLAALIGSVIYASRSSR
jgi:hypothetical protein